MSSERRIHLGTISTPPRSVELLSAPKKVGILDLLKVPFTKRNTPGTPVDLTKVVEEVTVEQKIDQSNGLIAPNAPKIEFQILAQKIRGAIPEDKEQILRTAREIAEVNKNALREGKEMFPVTALSVGVKTGGIAQVEDVKAEHIPFRDMPGKEGFRETGSGFAIYNLTEGSPFPQLTSGEVDTGNGFAVVKKEQGLTVQSGKSAQKGMAAVIMFDESVTDLKESTPEISNAEPPQLSESGISYVPGYRLPDAA